MARRPDVREFRAALLLLDAPTEEDLQLELNLQRVDAWIRDGMLVEALALLVGAELGGPASEWANLLGELLAPVPAHAPRELVAMHRALLTGGASVALALLEDLSRANEDLPQWASRRLELLRWMLLDNAQALPDEPVVNTERTPMAHALLPLFGARDLTGMAKASLIFQGGTRDERLVMNALQLLVAEMSHPSLPDLSSNHTVPVYGRPAAAMQLQMANLKGAHSIYKKMVLKYPGEADLSNLRAATECVLRCLEGTPSVRRNFPPLRPKSRLGLTTPGFDDETFQWNEQEMLARSPQARGGIHRGSSRPPQHTVRQIGFEPAGPAIVRFDDPTRVLPEEQKKALIGQTPPPTSRRPQASFRDIRFEDATHVVPEQEVPEQAFRGGVRPSPAPVTAKKPSIATQPEFGAEAEPWGSQPAGGEEAFQAADTISTMLPEAASNDELDQLADQVSASPIYAVDTTVSQPPIGRPPATATASRAPPLPAAPALPTLEPVKKGHLPAKLPPVSGTARKSSRDRGKKESVTIAPIMPVGESS